MGKGLGDRIAQGALFQRLKDRAIAYARDPDKLRDVLNRATSKAQAAGGRGVLAEVWDSLLTLLRLLRAYAKGDYRQVPGKSLILIIAGVLYFLTPIDFIPDFIVGLGFIDDVAILAWVANAVRNVLADFQAWETSRGGLRPSP